ncbi:MAG: hypothetical protein AB7I37_24355 [Pirellulales bacterium]
MSGAAPALPLAVILIVHCLSAFNARWKTNRTSSRQSRSFAATFTCTTTPQNTAKMEQVTPALRLFRPKPENLSFHPSSFRLHPFQTAPALSLETPSTSHAHQPRARSSIHPHVKTAKWEIYGYV